MPVHEVRVPCDQDLVGGIQRGGVCLRRVAAVRRGEQQKPLPEDGTHLQLAVEHGVAVDEGKVQLVVQKRLCRVHIPQGVDPQRYRQVQGQKPLVHRREDILVGGIGGGDAEIDPLLQLRQGIRLRQEALPPACQRQELLPGVGELDAALSLAPDEKRRTHPLLQRANAHGQGGLGDVQRLGRRRHGAVLHHRPERLDVQICHGVPPKIYKYLLIFYDDNFNFTSRSFHVIVKITKGGDAAASHPMQCKMLFFYDSFFFSPKSQNLPRRKAGLRLCLFSRGDGAASGARTVPRCGIPSCRNGQYSV